MKQFRSLIEFNKHFDTDAKCRSYLEQIRWADGIPVCPHCASKNVCRFPTGIKFKCRNKECRKQFSVTVGTVMESSKISLTKWFLAMYFVCKHSKGVSSVQVADFVGVTQKTAWFLLHRIREISRDKSQDKLRFIVECDETYIGGKNKNRHANKKIKDSQGRSIKGKSVVFGIIEREGRIRVMKVKDASSRTLKAAIESNVEEGSMIVTDEWNAYKGLSKRYAHEVVMHKQGEYVRGAAHTNNIESFWNMLKKCIFGIYHHVTPKHLDRYCDEVAYRFNHRGIKQDELFYGFVKSTEGRLKYEDLVRSNQTGIA